MVQRSEDAGFALETRQLLGMTSQQTGEKLDSDGPAEHHVLGLPHDTHRTLAELAGQAVVTDHQADLGLRRSGAQWVATFLSAAVDLADVGHQPQLADQLALALVLGRAFRLVPVHRVTVGDGDGQR